jgi:CHAT domain-containing protein
VITAQEILREWRLDADLVTLSGCETGLGKQVSGEGLVGFSHTFIQAGARNLLVSLWQVNDKATALLMTRFYQLSAMTTADGSRAQKAPRMSRAQALHEAKTWLRDYVDTTGRRPYTHPYFWSPFILFGGGW